MAKGVIMKKVRMTGFFLATIFCAFLGMSCQNDTVTADDGANIRDYSAINKGSSGGSTGGGGGSGAASTLYAKAEGFDIAVWGSWQTTSAPIADVSDGSDGGVRITSIERPDAGTYMGVNLAAGSGSGANADLDGKGFKQIKCKVRGTIKPNFASLYIINGTENEVGKDKNLSAFVGDKWSSTEWTEVTITGLNSSSKMSAGLIVFVDNDGCKFGDWIEIKEIDWQDANGTSVVPAYIN